MAELRAITGGVNASQYGAAVELVRVGVLKDILVLCYGNLNIVLMVVSWVAKHTDVLPRLCRDAHNFWLANIAAVPRDLTAPYILPSLASQVLNPRMSPTLPHMLRTVQYVHLGMS